jgi:GDP-L-fucose synthase
MSSKKIVVTGGNGFLGKSVCKKLRENKEYDVHCLYGKQHWDLTNQKQVDYLYKEQKPDVVVHLAARVGGIGVNKANPGLFFYENLAMGMNLIETARKYGKLKKFIMIGTVCSYPKYTPVPFKEESLWSGYPEETNAPYGISKKTLTEMLAAYNQQYGLNCTNLIPVNMYGPHDNFNPESSHVIPALILKFAKAIENNEKEVKVWGTGKASREFLYVDDCAEAIKRSVEIDTTPEPINIGTGSEISIFNLAEKIKDLMGYKGDIVFNSNGLDGQPRRCLDTSKAKQILGFEAETKFKKGLGDTIDWYYKNKEKFVDYFDHIQ